MTKRPCPIRLNSSHVSADDVVVFTEWMANEAIVESCPICSKAHDFCPWLTRDTGIADVVLCEDGNFNSQWACELRGQGGRALCPPNTTMCSGRACGGGLDHCCDPTVPDEELICIHSGGIRTCPYMSLQEGMQPVLNATHGPQVP